MTSGLFYFSVFYQNYPVCVPYRSQPVSDYQSSPSHRKLAERSLYLLFRYAVKGRGGFVEYEYRRVFKEYSGYGYSLFLASREESSPLSHVCLLYTSDAADE